MSLPRKIRGAAALFVSAAVVLSAPGPAAAQAVAGQFRAAVAAGRAVAPVPAAAGAVSLSAGLSAAALIPLSARVIAPSAAPAAAASFASARAVALSAAPAVAAPAQAAAAPAALLLRLFGAAPTASAAAPRNDDERAKLQAALTPADADLASPAASKDWAEKSFNYLKGDGSSSAAAPATAAPRRSFAASLARLATNRRVVAATIMGAVGFGAAAMADPAHSAPAPTAEVPPATGALERLGKAGYWIGNVLAFALSVPQVFKTFKDGSAKGAPAWRVAVFATAQLALGLVSATIVHKTFWGLQNVYGAALMLAVYPTGWWLARRGPAKTNTQAVIGTAVVSLASFAVAAAVYFGAAAVVPVLAAKFLAPAAVAKTLLWIQGVTGGLYFLLFLPDILSVLRGQAPKSFTPMFSLTYFAASSAFVLWTVQAALAAAPGSSERLQFLIYLGLNAAYALVSFVSFMIARKAARAEKAAKPEGTAAVFVPSAALAATA